MSIKVFNADFYPRSPCGERQPGERHASSQKEFLSTLSLRRATISPPADTSSVKISIHALLAESDQSRNKRIDRNVAFLSTLSLRRATFWKQPKSTKVHISIHALLAESDNKCDWNGNTPFEFLSTLSLRRATLSRQVFCSARQNFYPRSPCGERLWVLRHCRRAARISIHALLAESDNVCKAGQAGIIQFLSTLSLRRATERDGKRREYTPISIHALLAESD